MDAERSVGVDCSNDTRNVLGQTKTTKSQKQQLLLYGRVARQSDENPMRAATFRPGSLQAAVDIYIRKVWWPRLAWATEVGKLALQAAGGLQRLDEKIRNEIARRGVVEAFTSTYF